MRYLPSKKHEGITRVVNAEDKVVALIGSIKDLTNANIIKWCDCADVEKFLIIYADVADSPEGTKENGTLYDSLRHCMPEIEKHFYGMIYL